ncbi:hypothetical protein [Tenacibaculum sp. M341]|uniref:hypothetical protein n=1 Tax=Tenacibaculum sp. M341 TaxID=2530339 RepID=UPI00104D9AC6|nr:hypothetical protein [Tenacibaculum sp. M341]TCI84679.1 hypothetical protein EYW44_20155 [Tenacibaculum sp. M341]
MKLNSNAQNVEKEQIKFFKFPKKEVLNMKKDQINRSIDLRRALYLGNLERQKVKIVFADENGYKRVETTIWGVTDKSVILKQSTLIPLQRIVSVA